MDRLIRTEKDIENELLTFLNNWPGCFAMKYDVKGTWDPRGGFFRKAGKGVAIGGSDIVAVYMGLMLCFEVKTPQAYTKFFKAPGDHELRQQAFLRKVRSCGGFAEVVCSVDMVAKHMEKLRAGVLLHKQAESLS